MAFIGQGATNICKIFLTEYQVINELTGHQLWNWGASLTVGNNRGFAGDNTTVPKSSPVQTVSGGTNWSIAQGSAGIKTDGTLWMWGSNNCGLLGDNSSVDKSSPVQTVAGGSNWRSISTKLKLSAGSVVATKTDGTLWAWGCNANGSVGDNSTVLKSSPVQTVAGGTNWKSASVGGGLFSASSAGIKTDGTLWTWGINTGTLGDNSSVDKSSPVQTVSGGTNWKLVSVGCGFMSAIKTDGTMWTWGAASFGRLGNNAGSNTSSPAQVFGGGTNWKCTCSNDYHTAAIKTDGSLWLWGYGGKGNLGDNSSVSKSSPVQTVSGGNNWRSAIFAICSAAAIKTDGTLWTWGYNGCASLGNNTTTNTSSPVQTVAGGTNWRSVGAHEHTVSALRLFSGYDF